LENAGRSLDIARLAVGTLHEAPERAVIEASDVSTPWTYSHNVSKLTAIMDISRACGRPMGRASEELILRRDDILDL
jgi:hypothetical protein